MIAVTTLSAVSVNCIDEEYFEKLKSALPFSDNTATFPVIIAAKEVSIPFALRCLMGVESAEKAVSDFIKDVESSMIRARPEERKRILQSRERWSDKEPAEFALFVVLHAGCFLSCELGISLFGSSVVVSEALMPLFEARLNSHSAPDVSEFDLISEAKKALASTK